MASHRGAYAARSYETLRDYEPFEELTDAQKRAVLHKLDNPTSFHVSTFPLATPAATATAATPPRF